MAASANLRHAVPAPSFDDPLGMLLACHARMRRQLSTLERLQRHLPEHGADAEARAAAGAILRYFDQAGPNHHADEDQSVLPRLVARAPELASVAAGIAEDHRALDRRWRKVRALLSGIAAGVNEPLPPALVRDVCHAYRAHIEREETELVPRAREHFDAATLADIGREFAARRGQAYDAGQRPVR